MARGIKTKCILQEILGPGGFYGFRNLQLIWILGGEGVGGGDKEEEAIDDCLVNRFRPRQPKKTFRGREHTSGNKTINEAVSIFADHISLP